MLPLKDLQMIQFPLSIYDQRLIKDGTLTSLKNKGIKLLARSIFLQGILLTKSKNLPKFLSKEFYHHHNSLCKYLSNNGKSLLEAALGFALRQKYLDYILIGVTNKRELLEIIDTANNPNILTSKFISEDSQWSWDKISDIDPRNWPKY